MSSLLSPPEQQRPALFRSVSATSQNSTASSRTSALARTFTHKRDKLRLYLAVFSRGGSTGGKYGSQLSCDSYHWAIVLGPKSSLRKEAGTAYHIVHSASEFTNTPMLYEETDLADNPHLSRNLLARIAIAKVLNEERVLDLLRTLPSTLAVQYSKSSRTSSDSSDLEMTDYSCLAWTRSAWDTLSRDPQKPLRSFFGSDSWDGFENRARKYVRRKRLQGRYNLNTAPGAVTWNPDEVPTWNYWENRETTD